MKADSKIASNEGSLKGFIQLKDEAYEKMIDFSEISLSQCSDTIQDIYDAFFHVAEFELKKHNEVLKNVREKKRIPAIIIPGLVPEDIVVCKLSNCALPTNILGSDNIIKINMNFVKILQLLKLKGFCGNLGNIYDFIPEDPPVATGNLYLSIIYSTAIYLLRGRLKIDDHGFAKINRREMFAQSERGNKHLYNNTLAMLFYWVVLLEHNKQPMERIDELINNYPQLFRKFKSKQRRQISVHILEMCNNLIAVEAFPVPSKFAKTSETAEKIKNVLQNYKI